jgi:hypothetical protein
MRTAREGKRMMMRDFHIPWLLEPLLFHDTKDLALGWAFYLGLGYIVGEGQNQIVHLWDGGGKLSEFVRA